MGIEIGYTPYINALPFHFHLNLIKGAIKPIYALPTELNRLLSQGKLSGALTSSVAYLDNGYQLLPGYGIAADQSILSVNLYTQVPISDLQSARVALTDQSATAVSLLKVLCRHFWHVTPSFEALNRKEPYSKYAALLLIGDEALAHPEIPNFQTIDLAASWYTFTQLPFVFAVFAMKCSSSQEMLDSVRNQMHEALNWSQQHPTIIRKVAAEKSGLPEELIQKYYSLCKYCLGKKELESLALFKRLRAL